MGISQKQNKGSLCELHHLFIASFLASHSTSNSKCRFCIGYFRVIMKNRSCESRYIEEGPVFAIKNGRKSHFSLRAEATLFAKRILVGVHKTKGNDRKVESRGLFSVFERRCRNYEARAQAFNWKSRYSLFTDVCLLFAQLLQRLLLLQENQRKKRSEQKQLKENPFTGSHAMCLFFRNNNSEAFFQL